MNSEIGKGKREKGKGKREKGEGKTESASSILHSPSSLLLVRDITKSFGNAPLLRGMSFEIARGEIACLLGPSGSGKTTLLRIIAGLEDAESGAVIFEDQDMRGVPPHLRGFGLMFQDLALFPHKNVFDNIAFGLRMHAPHQTREQITRRVNEMLELVGLSNFAQRDVNQLSGGEQQRVALARALAPNPRLLMFDEPLGALDRILREQLVRDLRAILKRVGMTSLYVTHDQSEAFDIADRVLIIHDGGIVQAGAPQEVYAQPANSFVARFLGLDNLIRGRVIEKQGNVTRIETSEGKLEIQERGFEIGADVFVLIRPDAAHRIMLDSSSDAQEKVIRGQVIETRFRVGHPRVTIHTASGTQLEFDSAQTFSLGAQVMVELDAERISLLEE